MQRRPFFEDLNSVRLPFELSLQEASESDCKRLPRLGDEERQRGNIALRGKEWRFNFVVAAADLFVSARVREYYR